MTRDEFLKLDKFSVIRRLGVNYRVDDQDTQGYVKLTAYRQSPVYSIYKHPDAEDWLRQAHFQGDWMTNPKLRL